MDSERLEKFTRLLIRHALELIRYILVVVPNHTETRDILQEFSVSLWHKFGNYDSDRDFVPWALGFVRIEIQRFLRRSAHHTPLTERAAPLLLEEQRNVATDLDRRKFHLQKCMTQLSDRQKQMVDGYYRMEYSVSELSQRTAQTVESIDKSLQRIRGSLHDCIESRMRTAK